MTDDLSSFFRVPTKDIKHRTVREVPYRILEFLAAPLEYRPQLKLRKIFAKRYYIRMQIAPQFTFPSMLALNDVPSTNILNEVHSFRNAEWTISHKGPSYLGGREEFRIIIRK
jgi:hypothetical protein